MMHFPKRQFQIQIAFWGEYFAPVVKWQRMDGTSHDFEVLANAVGGLKARSYLGTRYAVMQGQLLSELSSSNSPSTWGIIVLNGNGPGNAQELIPKAVESPARLLGATVMSGGALDYLQHIAEDTRTVHAVHELQAWFVEIFRRLVVPETCTIS